MIELIFAVGSYLIETIIYFIIEIFFQKIIYYFGYVLIKIFTLGAFPKENHEKNNNRFPIAFLGLAILLIISILVFLIK